MIGRKKNKTSSVVSAVPSEAKPVARPVERPSERPVARPVERRPEPRAREMDTSGAVLGKSIQIKGELTGNEDLTVNGTVDGKIVLANNNLHIGTGAKITAGVSAKTVVIAGHVIGNVTAQERIEVRVGGAVEGDLCAPSVVLSEGAKFKGTVDMMSSPSMPETGTTFGDDSLVAGVSDSAFEDAVDDVIDDIVEDKSFDPSEGDTTPKDSKDSKDSKKSKGDEPKKDKKMSGMFDDFDPTNP